jgi:hypothetical protein
MPDRVKYSCYMIDVSKHQNTFRIELDRSSILVKPFINTMFTMHL